MIDVTNTKKPDPLIGGLPLDPRILNEQAPPLFHGYAQGTSPAIVKPVYWRTRLFSLVVLVAFAFALFRGALAAYHSFQDSFVAPIVLSPDSDLVIQAKLNMLRLQAERKTLTLRIDEYRNAILAVEEGVLALAELKRSIPKGLTWSSEVNSNASQLNQVDSNALSMQKELLDRAIEAQEATVSDLRRSLASGLVRKSDLTREEMELNRLHVATLQKHRELLSAEAQRQQTSLTQQALRGKSSRVLPPESVAAHEQSVRIDLESLKLQQEKRTKEAALHAAREDLATIDEMLGQMKARPIFRAISSEQNVAFVPYTQMEGVASGAAVYRCSLWGFFFCQQVGAVNEVLPGEVALQDPSGTPARGQYAILRLTDKTAGKDKMLRVRQRHDRPSTDLAALPGSSLGKTDLASN